MIRTLTLTALLAGLALPAAATGRYTCEAVERSSWISEDALTQQLVEEGWSVRFMKEDGGCWEVYGTDTEGRRVEGYFHPVSGEPLLISQRGKVLFRADQ